MLREEWAGALRTILESRLEALSVVDSPAYAGATVAEVRANCRYVETPVPRVWF